MISNHQARNNRDRDNGIKNDRAASQEAPLSQNSFPETEVTYVEKEVPIAEVYLVVEDQEGTAWAKVDDGKLSKCSKEDALLRVETKTIVVAVENEKEGGDPGTGQANSDSDVIVDVIDIQDESPEEQREREREFATQLAQIRAALPEGASFTLATEASKAATEIHSGQLVEEALTAQTRIIESELIANITSQIEEAVAQDTRQSTAQSQNQEGEVKDVIPDQAEVFEGEQGPASLEILRRIRQEEPDKEESSERAAKELELLMQIAEMSARLDDNGRLELASDLHRRSLTAGQKNEESMVRAVRVALDPDQLRTAVPESKVALTN